MDLIIKIAIVLYGLFLFGGSLTCAGGFIYHLLRKIPEGIAGNFVIGSVMGIWGFGLIRRFNYSRIMTIVINAGLGIFCAISSVYPDFLLGKGQEDEYALGILSAVRFWAAIIFFMIVFLFTRKIVKKQFK